MSNCITVDNQGMHGCLRFIDLPRQPGQSVRLAVLPCEEEYGTNISLGIYMSAGSGNPVRSTG